MGHMKYIIFGNTEEDKMITIKVGRRIQPINKFLKAEYGPA